MELTNLGRLTGQWVLESPALCHSCTRTTELYSCVQHFTWVLGIQTQVLRFAQHTLHQQSHLEVSVPRLSLLSSFALSSVEKLNREVGDLPPWLLWEAGDMWETSTQHNCSVLIRNELKWKVAMSLHWKSEEIWTFPSGTKNFMWQFYQVLLEEKATVETTSWR